MALHQFAASAPSARCDSAGAADAISQAVSQAFDAILPWLAGELQRAVVGGKR